MTTIAAAGREIAGTGPELRQRVHEQRQLLRAIGMAFRPQALPASMRAVI
jgi:hypothetical protein